MPSGTFFSHTAHGNVRQGPSVLLGPSTEGGALRPALLAPHRRCYRRRRAASVAAAGRGGPGNGSPGPSSSGSGGSSSGDNLQRREIILQAVNWAILGDLVGTDDARTVVNSILGAYGLPQLKATKGFKYFDDFEADYVFEYPRSWVARPNRNRQGIYISDFNTADKLTVEVFEREPGQSLADAVVAKIIDPANQVGGDSKLFFPTDKQVKSEEREVDGQRYTYLFFPSETITRSGYQVRRKNWAVAAEKRGNIYCLGASARTDQYNADKEALLRHIVDSFRVR